jgi:A/G-specific adenine glycosylase
MIRGKKSGTRSARPVDSGRSKFRPESLARGEALLAWYDRHRRILPWRARPGEQPDPYRVWLSEIMLQQTTVKAVAPYFVRFVARWPTLHALAAAPLEDVLRLWAGLGYYARARNLHACAKAVVERHSGEFPRHEAELAKLPGIGPYSAAAIAAIAFGVRTAAIEANGERVLARLFAVEAELPGAKPQLHDLAEGLLPLTRAGDFAQAVMDLGATICTPKRPACALCPWTDACAAHRRGDPESFPRKIPSPKGELRRGAAFVLVRADDAVLLRSRPAKGLLGGMTEVPNGAWTHQFNEASALADAPRPPSAALRWRRVPGTVEHVFTHFPLRLSVYMASATAGTPPPGGMRWVALSRLSDEALPTLMRKVITHALSSRATRATILKSPPP